MNLKFTQQVDDLDQKNYNMGIIEYLQQEAREEGLKTGYKAAQEKLTRSLLERKFPVSEIAKMLDVSTYFVNKIKKQARLN